MLQIDEKGLGAIACTHRSFDAFRDVLVALLGFKITPARLSTPHAHRHCQCAEFSSHEENRSIPLLKHRVTSHFFVNLSSHELLCEGF